MICTCIRFLQHCCCSDARVQDAGWVQQRATLAIITLVASWDDVGYEQLETQTQAGVKYKSIGNKNKLPFWNHIQLAEILDPKHLDTGF